MNTFIQQLFIVVLLLSSISIYAQQQNILPGAYIVQFSSSFRNLRTNNHVRLLIYNNRILFLLSF